VMMAVDAGAIDGAKLSRLHTKQRSHSHQGNADCGAWAHSYEGHLRQLV
jgi:hypothetical protein